MAQCDKSGLTEREFLKQYKLEDYPRPSVTTDMVIFTVGELAEDNFRKLPEKEFRLLLIRRGVHPYLGQWALPGGFVRPGETVGQAAQRELMEEAGVASGYLEQLFTFSEPGRDPRGWVLSCAHMALIDSRGVGLTAGDDAGEARWFQIGYEPLEQNTPTAAKFSQQTRRCRLSLRSGGICLSAVVEEAAGRHSVEFKLLENEGLAFDHARIIACAVHRLRNKVEYTDLALNLMPTTFTLTELQQVYEVILGRLLLKAAFRRKIAGLVRETGEFRENAGYRPSQLFRRYWEED